VDVGGPEGQVSQDLLDDRGLLDTRDEPHGSATARAHQGIRFIDLRDEARPVTPGRLCCPKRAEPIPREPPQANPGISRTLTEGLAYANI
jgi:hypothetical protein